ncbi:MAG: LruC domain-containing protein [Bacteroidia bacterium]
MKFKILYIVLIVLAFGCRKEVYYTLPSNTNPQSTAEIIAPENFKWQFLQDYLVTISTDTLLDNVTFSLINENGVLVYNGKINFGYATFSLRIPRDIKTLKIVSNNPKIFPNQTIDLYNSVGTYKNSILIKNNLLVDKLWIKKLNENIEVKSSNQLNKGGIISDLWDKNEFVFTRTVFEDLWPSRADFDFNDMVVDNFNTVVLKDAINRPAGAKRPIGLGNKVISQLKGIYVVQANGAGFNNGLAVQLFGEHHYQNGTITNMNSIYNYIQNFTFSNSTGKQNAGATIENLANGEVVIRLFSKINDIIIASHPNTDPFSAFGIGDTVYVTINLNDKVSEDYWKGKLCNFTYSHPFLLQNGVRSVEIHVAGEMPTMLANTAIFGTGEDNTNLANGKTYVSKKNNFPWAMTVPSNFKWPTEKRDMLKAYPNFGSWVVKNGVNINEWRYNKVDSLLKAVD